MEMVADPCDAKIVAALCHTSVEYFRKRKAHFILCVLSDHRFRKVLRQFLFLKVGTGKAILLGNMERINIDKDYLTDTGKWHVTLGESDTLMLSDSIR